MSEDDLPVVAEPIRIPSRWRAMKDLAGALDMLDQNPDLVGDDIIFALQSEAPNVPRFLDSIVATIQDKKGYAAVRRERSAAIATLAHRDEAASEKLRDLLITTMQQLNITQYRCPTGVVSLASKDGGLIVTDEDLVPKEYKSSITVIDKRRLNEAAKANPDQPIAGTTRGNGRIIAIIRG